MQKHLTTVRIFFKKNRTKQTIMAEIRCDSEVMKQMKEKAF